ncbi:type II secretion system protein [Candidatus Microgenomates bacterium]|nr:type II secretion system protein [Candidatus Microgenomates bacterium]
MKKDSGFSLFELLIVMAIMGILAALLSPFLSRFLFQYRLADTTDKFVKTLRKAQNYTFTGKEDSEWGVHYESGQLVLFKGNVYGEDHSFDEEFGVSPSLNISGWNDIAFSKIRGKPSSGLTVSITSTAGSRTIILNEEGMVDVQ